MPSGESWVLGSSLVKPEDDRVRDLARSARLPSVLEEKGHFVQLGSQSHKGDLHLGVEICELWAECGKFSLEILHGIDNVDFGLMHEMMP
jgi:hypothetical protein